MTTNTVSPRIWFITGATSGIGQEFARAALEHGDSVVGLARDTKPLVELGKKASGRLLALTTDVRDEAAVTAAVAAAIAKFGRIDVVVNNAAFGIFGGVEEISDAQWRSIFDTNVFGALNVLRATLPVLRRQRSGWILQGSAHYGQHAHAGVSAVAATKHAMEGWTDALAQEVAPLGIKVLNYEPGMTATPFIPKLKIGENVAEDYNQTVRAGWEQLGKMPAAAFNTPERVVAAVLTAMNAAQPPRRIATGTICYNWVYETLKERLADLETWANVSRGVDTPAA